MRGPRVTRADGTDCGARAVMLYGYDARTNEPMFIHPDVRRIWNVDGLPMVCTFLCGRRWRADFGVEQRPIAEVNPPWADLCRADRRWVLTFTLEDDVRERVIEHGEELRPGVFAMWDDETEASA